MPVMSQDSESNSRTPEVLTENHEARSGNGIAGEEFDAVDAVSLFNKKLETALERQKSTILSEIQDKFKQTNAPEFRGEGNKIQFLFNQDRIRGLDGLSQKLFAGDFSGAIETLKSEKEAFRQRNKILRIADKHGWDTVKEYVDSDIADNSEDAAKIRAAISRAAAAKKRKSPYDRPQLPKTPGAFDGLSNQQLFLGNSKFGFRQDYQSRPFPQGYRKPKQLSSENNLCLYCRLPGHFAKFCPYTDQMQFTGDSSQRGQQTTSEQFTTNMPASTASQQ